MKIDWICPHFNELSTEQLYDLLQLRQDVFVVEQNCPYLDADGKDQVSWHPMGYLDGELVACTRIVPKGVSYEGAVAIGRVATSQKIRRKGVGIDLMKYSLEQTKKRFPADEIHLSAQTYLLKFYNNLGFKEIGEEYLEDDIPHRHMVLVK